MNNFVGRLGQVPIVVNPYGGTTPFMTIPTPTWVQPQYLYPVAPEVPEPAPAVVQEPISVGTLLTIALGAAAVAALGYALSR